MEPRFMTPEEKEAFVNSFDSIKETATASLSKEIAKATGLSEDVLKISMAMEYQNGVRISVTSAELTPHMGMKMFRSLKIKGSNGDLGIGSDDKPYIWISIDYRHENFSGGTNGVEIMSAWLNADGTLRGVRLADGTAY